MPALFRWLRFFILVLPVAFSAAANPPFWRSEWPNTDFSKHSVDYQEIIGGGPPRDGIPLIDMPSFVPVADVSGYRGSEPVIGLEINGDRRAYPLGILTWHEIVNDVVGGVPVARYVMRRLFLTGGWQVRCWILEQPANCATRT